MPPLLVCQGVSISGVYIPPFEVTAGQLVRVSIPLDYGGEWDNIAEVLSGRTSTIGIQNAANTVKIDLPGFLQYQPQMRALSIVDFILAKGVAAAIALELIDKLKIPLEQRYTDLQLTTRVLVDLSIAWIQGAQLIVFSTAGLDPAGTRAVMVEVISNLHHTSAIEVFSAAAEPDDASFRTLSRMIHCARRGDNKQDR